MSRFLSPILFAAVAAVASAQSFECSPPGVNFPIGNTTNCENARWNGVGPFGGARNELDCGMPAAGSQYALLVAGGPISVGAHPAATLPARPLNANVAELLFDAPVGATGISFRYNFFNAEASNESDFNDGMEIAICDSITGARIQSLVYVDTFSPSGTNCSTVFGIGTDWNAPGVDTFGISFGGPLPAGYYLSVACWNSLDEFFDSSVEIDCIAWVNSWEVGFLSGPRVVNTSPATHGNQGFVVGLPMSVQTQAGLPYIEGFHCMVAQLWDGNLAQQVAGIAGDFYPCTDRPWVVLSEGLLTGGINPGRGPNVSLTFPMSMAGDLCGRGVVIQSYVITELLTNESFTTAEFGWFTVSNQTQP